MIHSRPNLYASLALLAILLCACGSAGRIEGDCGDDGEAVVETEPGSEGEAERAPDAPPDARDLDAAGDDAQGLDPPADRAEAEQRPVCDEDSPFTVEKGGLGAGDDLTGVRLAECTEHVYSLKACGGSAFTLKLASDRIHPVRLGIFYPDDTDPGSRLAGTWSGWSPGQTRFEAPRSGEFLLSVRGEDPHSTAAYDLAVECADGCDRECTRYPIVMVHGWTGWSSIGPYEYFYEVPGTLEEKGYLVFVPTLDPYNSTEVRSGQLAEALDAVLEEGRARKVNLIAHSQGGLDSRRAVSTLGYGDRVGALATIATPHRGTPITDIALGILPGASQDALYFLLNLLGATGGHESEAEASFTSLSELYVRGTFNPANPDDPRVVYLSWTGNTCLTGDPCGDVCDIEVVWSYLMIYDVEGDNDGMVPVESGRYGDFLGVIPADHFDEVGQLLGITGPNFDHRQFYLGVAREIAGRGL